MSDSLAPALGWWARFRAQPKDSPLKTVLVALAVSLVCSMLVTFTAVTLRPANVLTASAKQQQLIILQRAGLVGPGNEILDWQVETRIVHLDSGDTVVDVPVELADPKLAGVRDDIHVPIPGNLDQARIGRRLHYSLVHLVFSNRRLTHIILPVYGSGMWAPLFGYLTLEPDANTVVDIRFYVNGETPGIGDRIDDSEWRSSWKGKQIYDEDGAVRIRIPRRPLATGDPAARFEVDALSGATKTTRSVLNLVHYWLGDHGFKAYLMNFDFAEAES